MQAIFAHAGTSERTQFPRNTWERVVWCELPVTPDAMQRAERLVSGHLVRAFFLFDGDSQHAIFVIAF